jgi:hypothetical protein
MQLVMLEELPKESIDGSKKRRIAASFAEIG